MKEPKLIIEKERLSATEAQRLLDPQRAARVTVAGNVIDIVQTAVEPKEIPTVRRGYNERGEMEYIDTRSGEIFTAARSKSRGDKMSQQQLKKSMRKMREICNANFFGASNELHIVLTYKENMTDHKQLMKDLEKFVKKTKRALGEIKYLAAVEPQQRGAWHAHILVKQLHAHSTYWPPDDVAELWGHGFVKIQSLRRVDNVGAYLTAYLSNAPDEDASALAERVKKMREAGEEPPKSLVKGARLAMYPPGIHIYRASKNCERPEAKKMRPHSADIKSVTATAAPRFAQRTYLYLEDEHGARHLINTITQIQYNSNPRMHSDD